MAMVTQNALPRLDLSRARNFQAGATLTMQRLVMYLIFASLLLAASATDASASATPSQKITLTILTCPEAEQFGTSPIAKLTFLGDSGAVRSMLLSPRADHTYVGVLNAAPGHYSLLAQDGFCVANEYFTVLPDSDRDLSMVLRQGGRTIYDFDAYLAGALPVGGILEASLMTKSGDSIPLLLDGRAYYGEGLREGQYTLNLSIAGGLVCRIPVDLKRPGEIFNIDASDMLRSMGRLLKYPGRPSEFELLWPHPPII
jgi:hypothetical protein